jgi:hypothetical protein
MKWALGIQGGEFAIARAVKIYSREQLRAFREQIKRLDNYLPNDVYDQAIQVIRAEQHKQDKQFLSLIEALSENRASVGEFINISYQGLGSKANPSYVLPMSLSGAALLCIFNGLIKLPDARTGDATLRLRRFRSQLPNPAAAWV